MCVNEYDRFYFFTGIIEMNFFIVLVMQFSWLLWFLLLCALSGRINIFISCVFYLLVYIILYTKWKEELTNLYSFFHVGLMQHLTYLIADI